MSSTRRAAPVLGLALLLSAGGVLLAACGDDAPPAATSASPLVDDLCAAVDAPDAETGAERFEGDVHGPLHTFIDEVTAVDRALAQELLLAKFDVENALQGDELPPLPELSSMLRTLLDHVLTGADLLGTPATDCQEP